MLQLLTANQQSQSAEQHVTIDNRYVPADISKTGCGSQSNREDNETKT